MRGAWAERSTVTGRVPDPDRGGGVWDERDDGRGGGHIGDVGNAIESFAKPLGYGLAEGLAGHGVGYNVHEDPFVPNEGRKGSGELLRPGMVIAIEPMLTLGTSQVRLAQNNWAYKTADGSKAAHFEHTIVITDREAIILT